MNYKKSDVTFHGEYMRRGYPAVNVKCRDWPTAVEIAKRLGCSEELAQKASELAYESAVEQFWHYRAPAVAEDRLGKEVEIFSEGRSSGWLVVHDLPEIEEWDAPQLAKWHSFENGIEELMRDLGSLDTVCREIEENKWHLDGAELYNFVEQKDGSHVCIAELKRDAIEAGFGAVVR